jgi:hypothetical protein
MTADGEEMRVIYIDSSPDDEHEERNRNQKAIGDALDQVWKERLSVP